MSKKKNTINGLNIIGHHTLNNGISESMRSFVKCFDKYKIPTSLVNTDQTTSRFNITEFSDRISNQFIYPVNILWGDMYSTPDVAQQYGWKRLKGCYNIGYLAWETNVLPKNFERGFKYLDEVWVYSGFIQEHFKSALTLPIHRISQPIMGCNSLTVNPKKLFNISQKYTFLFCFDYKSIMERKNPLAIFKAFQRAFPSSNDVQLIIKTHNGAKFPSERDSLLNYSQEDSRISIIDKTLDAQGRWDLLNACDCYISLHRAEGLGLTMAESMILGKPVIATGYSGNLEFMNEENSFLCSYQLKQVGSGYFPYTPDAVWADVDVEHAAYWMSYVFNNPIEAQIKARKGQEFIQKNHSEEAVYKQMMERLNNIKIRRMPKMPPWDYLKIRANLRWQQYGYPCLRPFLKPIINCATSILKKIKT